MTQPKEAPEHIIVRSEIRQCKSIEDFEHIYTDSEFYRACIGNLRNAQLGQDREAWAEKWARALSKEEKWAQSLNSDRKTVLLLLYELCDRLNEEKVTEDDILKTFKSGKIKDIFLVCLVMDRANAMFNMIDHSANLRGMHWYAELDTKTMQASGYITMDCDDGHTMNRRLIQLYNMEELGLQRNLELSRWIQPALSPLRVGDTASIGIIDVPSDTSPGTSSRMPTASTISSGTTGATASTALRATTASTTTPPMTEESIGRLKQSFDARMGIGPSLSVPQRTMRQRQQDPPGSCLDSLREKPIAQKTSKFVLSVSSPGRAPFEIEVGNQEIDVKTVKERLARMPETGYCPTSRQHLIYKGQVLDDASILVEYGIVNGSRLTLEKIGIRVLSLDGGGVRGIASITILQNLKVFLNGKEPYEVFDVICGTSTGGLIAILLGILKIPLDDCAKIYEEMGEKVFDLPARKKLMPGRLLRKIAFEYLYDPEALESVIKKHVEEKLGNADCRMNNPCVRATLGSDDTAPMPHVFVVAKPAQSPFVFRNYESNVPNGTWDVKIWEAARATSAAPKFFPPIVIHNIPYIDGGVGYNNPTMLAIEESRNMPELKGLPLSCIFSIGTGLAETQCVDPKTSLKGLIDELAKSVTDCERVHREVSDRLEDVPNATYERVNPTGGLGKIKLDMYECIPQMVLHANEYLTTPEIRKVMKNLSKRLARNEELND